MIAGLHVYVFLHGKDFSNRAAAAVRLPGMRPGWLLGRQVDLSDAQWRSFRGSLPSLAAAMGSFALLSSLVRRLTQKPAHRAAYIVAFSLVFLGGGGGQGGYGGTEGAGGLASAIVYYLLQAYIPILKSAPASSHPGVLHGWCLLHVLALSLAHFALSLLLAGRRHGLALIWAASCALLVLVRVTEGLPFSMIRWAFLAAIYPWSP